MTVENPPFEDEFTIEHGDFPMVMLVFRGVDVFVRIKQKPFDKVTNAFMIGRAGINCGSRHFQIHPAVTETGVKKCGHHSFMSLQPATTLNKYPAIKNHGYLLKPY